MIDPELLHDRRRLRRSRTAWRIAALVALAVSGLLVLALVGGVGGGTGALPQVARIDVDGFIDTRPKAVETIERAAKADHVKAILIRINSPGGAASGGEALYRAVRNASAKKPVVAVIDGLGASAAYMTAIAADRVIARESAVTGSIGVIFQSAHVDRLLDRIGIGTVEVKSAPLKAEPSPFKAPDPAALAMVKALIDDTYRWFVGLVAERRNLPQAEALRLADGRIFTGRQALAAKLVDEVGDEDTARRWLASAKSVSTDLRVEDWKEDDGGLGALFGETALSLLGLDRLAASGAALVPPGFLQGGLLALWTGPRALAQEAAR